MKLTTIILLLIALSSMFIVGCASTTPIDQPSTADEVVQGELDEFVGEDFVQEDEFVELGELI